MDISIIVPKFYQGSIFSLALVVFYSGQKIPPRYWQIFTWPVWGM